MITTRVLRLPTTQSTNADALRLAREGHDGPLWLVAREQLGGRGRHGRMWCSPPGNLYASLLLIDPCRAEMSPQLSFVASVALAEAVEAVLGPGHAIQLKWPNDLLYEGAKISGILLEASRRGDGALVCVIGIGVNCRSHPSDLAYPATHLAGIASRDVSPEDLLPLLDQAMLRGLETWRGGENFPAIRDAWLARAAGRGRPVEVVLHDRVAHGTFDTVDTSGRLIVTTAEGRLTVEAGDVRFSLDRPSPAMTGAA